MAHQFTVKANINGVSIDEFKRLVSDISMHEAVCRRIPAQNMEILVSEKQGEIYTLKRAYNLDVNIPDIAKKLLRDAFRLQRTDISNLEHLTSTVELGANLPIEATCQRAVKVMNARLSFNWTGP